VALFIAAVAGIAHHALASPIRRRENLLQSIIYGRASQMAETAVFEKEQPHKPKA
jgi:hypothetical protein